MERTVSLEKAVKAYGGNRALARRIDVRPQTSHGWRNARRGLPRLAVLLITAAATEDGIDVWVNTPKRGARRKKTTH